MAENKSKLVEKIVRAGITTGLCLLPILSNGQKIAKPVENINWTKQQKSSYDKYILLINSKNALPGLSRYKSGVPKEYLSKGGNLNLYTNHYEIPQDQIQGYIADYLRKIGVCPECCPKPKRTVSKDKGKTGKTITKPVPQKPIVPPINKLEKKIVEESDTLKRLQKGEQGISYNVVETNTTNNITNNYYATPQEIKAAADTASKKAKEDYLRFRVLIDSKKKVNPITSPFWQSTINLQIGRDWLWFGPDITFGFGSENNSTETPVYKKILLSQAANLFAETEGIRNGSSNISCPIGFGGTLSLNTKDNRVRFDLSYGLVNEINSTSGVSESGFDRKLQGDRVIEEKPYGPIYLKNGMKYKKWIPTQGIGMAFQPSNKVPLYVIGKAEHIGKISSKKGNFNFNIGIGGNIGWNKK